MYRMNYKETLEYLYSRLPVFHQVGAAAYKPGLDNSIDLMNRLGNPQNRYKTIHVAGTNGKGSVSHFLSAILQSAGYKTGLYTSPHLVDFGERIRVNGEQIEQNYVVDFTQQHFAFFEKVQPSFFEATMAMAFNYFADCNVDFAIIEVGLGGRLDSTNIISPLLSVITNIGFDHTMFLGNTLEKIAFEKAGIIKPNTPVVIGETLPETKPVFLRKALSINAPIVFAEENYKVDFVAYETERMVVAHSDTGRFAVELQGDYQLKNIATTLACIDELKHQGYPITFEHIQKGFGNVSGLTGLQGRWQLIGRNPTVILDTGHNKDGIEYVVNQLKRQHYNTLHMVVGMVDDKDIHGILELLPKEALYYFAAAKTKRALPSAEIQKQAEKYSLYGNAYDSVEEAVTTATNRAASDDLVFVGGSNFIVGEALEILTRRA